MSDSKRRMSVRFNELTIECRKNTYKTQFAPQVTFFHGKIASGKSSVVRLIDFCLGGTLAKTRAMSEELISARLIAMIAGSEVVFERDLNESARIRVSWSGPQERGSVSALVRGADKSPIWGEDIYNMSDLMFHLLGARPLKVRLAEENAESELLRLSFRDLVWYCYLKQEELTSTFFNLDIPIYLNKSRSAMRFLLGDYTYKLADLEQKLEAARENRTKKMGAASELHSFLSKFGYGTVDEINSSISDAEQSFGLLEAELAQPKKDLADERHIADKLREALRKMSIELDKEKNTEYDLQARISKQEALVAELISAKVRHARGESASHILSGVSFEKCPSCGTKVRQSDELSSGACALCGRVPSPSGEKVLSFEFVQADLSSRIDELTENIGRHKAALVPQRVKVQGIADQKAALDKELEKQSAEYDSRYLASSRHVEREMGSLSERVLYLKEGLRMIEAARDLDKEAASYLALIDTITRDIEAEKSQIPNIDRYIRDIESDFHEALLETGVPGVFDDDTVELDRKKWIPTIYHKGDPGKGWTFEEAGSAGKKTLLKTCYALALHRVASEHGLPLPTYLVIDAPMDHIGKDVNHDIFVNFYNYLYKLVEGPLADTQFVIVDQDYVEPKSGRISIKSRYMTPDDPSNPPLIEYYRGP